jgi:hypothetical protein
VGKTPQERQQEARQAKLDHIQEQIESGELVIRTMTAAEKARWAQRSRADDTASTPTERARRAAALANRRKRAERVD